MLSKPIRPYFPENYLSCHGMKKGDLWFIRCSVNESRVGLGLARNGRREMTVTQCKEVSSLWRERFSFRAITGRSSINVQILYNTRAENTKTAIRYRAHTLIFLFAWSHAARTRYCVLYRACTRTYAPPPTHTHHAHTIQRVNVVRVHDPACKRMSV